MYVRRYIVSYVRKYVLLSPKYVCNSRMLRAVSEEKACGEGHTIRGGLYCPALLLLRQRTGIRVLLLLISISIITNNTNY